MPAFPTSSYALALGPPTAHLLPLLLPARLSPTNLARLACALKDLAFLAQRPRPKAQPALALRLLLQLLLQLHFSVLFLPTHTAPPGLSAFSRRTW